MLSPSLKHHYTQLNKHTACTEETLYFGMHENLQLSANPVGSITRLRVSGTGYKSPQVHAKHSTSMVRLLFGEWCGIPPLQTRLRSKQSPRFPPESQKAYKTISSTTGAGIAFPCQCCSVPHVCIAAHPSCWPVPDGICVTKTGFYFKHLPMHV